MRVGVGIFNMKMSSCRYRKFHCGGKTTLRPSYLPKWYFLYWYYIFVLNYVDLRCHQTCLPYWLFTVNQFVFFKYEYCSENYSNVFPNGLAYVTFCWPHSVSLKLSNMIPIEFPCSIKIFMIITNVIIPVHCSTHTDYTHLTWLLVITYTLNVNIYRDIPYTSLCGVTANFPAAHPANVMGINTILTLHVYVIFFMGSVYMYIIITWLMWLWWW